MFDVRQHKIQTSKWWFTHRIEIDMDPPYQRKGKLWSPHDRAYLIDSMLNEYDIPKIYLADFTLSDTKLNIKKKAYAVIDGKQRLEAIFGFYLNEFALNKDCIFYKNPIIKVGGLFYSDLVQNYPEIVETFEEFNLHVMSVITDDEAKINDLFVRLNTSKPLTGAEIRNAMTGKIPSIIRELTKHQLFTDKINFSIKRGQDRNAIAKLLLIEFRGKLVDTKKTHLDRFVEEGMKSETDNIERAKDRVHEYMDEMCKVFVDRDPLLDSQGNISVYYWLIRLLGAKTNLREYLVRFEERRRINRQKAKTDPSTADPQLLNYDILNRSTNDQGSLEGRIEILLSKYSEFNSYIAKKQLEKIKNSIDIK